MVSSITIDGHEYAVACNAFTPIIYSGGLRYTKENGKTRAKDINDGISAIMDTMSDYDIPPFLPLAEFFWAFHKTADKNAPDFKSFMESLPAAAFDVASDGSWAEPVMEAVIENFLPSFKGLASPTSEEAAAEAADGDQ